MFWFYVGEARPLRRWQWGCSIESAPCPPWGHGGWDRCWVPCTLGGEDGEAQDTGQWLRRAFQNRSDTTEGRWKYPFSKKSTQEIQYKREEGHKVVGLACKELGKHHSNPHNRKKAEQTEIQQLLSASLENWGYRASCHLKTGVTGQAQGLIALYRELTNSTECRQAWQLKSPEPQFWGVGGTLLWVLPPGAPLGYTEDQRKISCFQQREGKVNIWSTPRAPLLPNKGLPLRETLFPEPNWCEGRELLSSVTLKDGDLIIGLQSAASPSHSVLPPCQWYSGPI